MFNSSLYLAPFCLQLLLSIFALIFLIVKWESSSARALMVAFVILGFLIPSTLAVISTLVYAFVSGGGFNVGYQFFEMFIGFISIVARVLPLITLVVLLFYISQRKKCLDHEFSRFLKNAGGESEASEFPVVAPVHVSPPLAWNTELDSHQHSEET